MGAPAQMKRAVVELVERSRLGDQNATAILVQVRENAEKGDEKAKVSHAMMLAYAKSHPPGTPLPQFGISASASGSATVSPLGRLRDSVRKADSPKTYAICVTTHVPKAGLSIRSTLHAAHALARGPAIGAAVLGAVHGTFKTDRSKKVFSFAVKATPARALACVEKTQDLEEKTALQLGFALGQARRVQEVQKPGTPLAAFSRVAAWELGEPGTEQFTT